MKPLPIKTGYLYALMSAILFGLSIPVAKYLLNYLSPWLLAGILYFGAGIGLSIIYACQYFLKKQNEPQHLYPTDLIWLAGSIIFGGIVGPLLLMYGVLKTSAASSSLLLNFESIFTAMIAWIIFHEHTNRKLIIGTILIIFGGILLSWNYHLIFANLTGPLFILSACCAWAIDNNLTRNIAGANPIQIVIIKSLTAGIINILLASFIHAKMPQHFTILLISAGIGFVAYGLSIVYFILALRHLGTARTTICFSLSPFIGAVAAIIFLHESFSWLLALAGILMLIGVILHLMEEHSHEHQHDYLAHEHSHSHDEHHQHEHPDSLEIKEPHSHWHEHHSLIHSHPHYPDIHHQHKH